MLELGNDTDKKSRLYGTYFFYSRFPDVTDFFYLSTVKVHYHTHGINYYRHNWQHSISIMHHLRCCMPFSVHKLTMTKIHNFWTAITFPLRKWSRWVCNMQQFVWSLRCLFRTAFACNYNKLGSMPCHWCIPFVLRSNFLSLRGGKKAALCFF